MGKLLIVALTAILTSYAASNGRGKFVSTPVPDEIRSVIYSTQTSAGTRAWRLTNDDLIIKSSSKLATGKILSSQAKKMKANDMNWIIFSLGETNFTKVKSAPTRRASFGNESLVVITQDGSYTFTQNSETRFPPGFQKVVNVIPKLAN